jgi:hypothetical protein
MFVENKLEKQSARLVHADRPANSSARIVTASQRDAMWRVKLWSNWLNAHFYQNYIETKRSVHRYLTLTSP